MPLEQPARAGTTLWLSPQSLSCRHGECLVRECSALSCEPVYHKVPREDIPWDKRMSPHITSREAESQKIPTRDAGSTAGVSKNSRPSFTPTTVDQGHGGPVQSGGLGLPTLLEMGLTTMFTSQAIFPTLQILNRALA